MSNKSLLWIGALALSSLSIASAKSYDIMLSEPAKAGNVQLKAGEYKLRVAGTNAVLTDVNSGNKVTLPITIETTATKHAETAVDTNEVNGATTIKSIELSGSTETLDFGL